MCSTNHHLDNSRCTSSNRWLSVFADCLNGVLTTSFSVFPINDASRYVIHNRNQITFELPHWQTNKYWCCVDAYFVMLSIQNVLPSSVVFILISSYWSSVFLNDTQLFGYAVPSNILAMVSLIQYKFIAIAKWFIAPAIILFINQCWHVTAYYSPIIFF